jgi:putative membrane protein
VHVVTAELLAAGSSPASAALTTALTATVGVAGTAYWIGVRRLLHANATSPWRQRRYAFVAGLVVLVAVLLPQWEQVLTTSFPAHMGQHIVLLAVAAPLLALGAPGLPLLVALPIGGRRRISAMRTSGSARRLRALAAVPAVVVLVYTGVVSAWHLPTFYDAALSSVLVHITEHATLLGVGWWFWSSVTLPARRLDGRTVLYVAVGGLPMTFIGAVLTFAPVPLYPGQTGSGPEALREQQLAGLLMWVPTGIVYLVLCLGLALLWLRTMERDAPAEVPLPPAVPAAALDPLAVARAGRVS